MTVIQRLEEQGVYSRIYLCDDQAGSNMRVFEIYKSNVNDNKKKAERVNDVLKYVNIFFIATAREDLNCAILQKTNRNPGEFENYQYLIREKNTLRLANDDEEKSIHLAETKRNEKRLAKITAGLGNLNTTDSKSSISSDDSDEENELDVKKVMNRSYGRMAIAHHRARDRYHQLVVTYNEIFDFKLKELDEGKKLEISNSKDCLPQCEAYYGVTMKDNYGQALSLKKVFEILQVYNSTSSNPYPRSKNDIIDGSIPLLVHLNIGSTKTGFMLSQWPSEHSHVQGNQLLVSTKVRSGNAGSLCYKGRAYWNYIVNFDSKMARFMLACLNAPVEKQPDGEEYDEAVITNIVEFLATTQIAESNHGKRNYNHSRTPGMNKLARKVLRSIGDECYGFPETFHHNSTSNNIHYPAIGVAGTRIARDAVRKIERKGARCDDMSEDSD